MVEDKVWLGPAAAAAKSLQSCPTLRDPMDCSPLGSSAHGIFQGRVLSGLPWPSEIFLQGKMIKLINKISDRKVYLIL